jgi:putative sterol carrier protein
MTSYATFRSLIYGDEDDIGETFKRMAEVLRDSGEHAQIQFRIVGAQRVIWSLNLEEDSCTTTPIRVERPNLEVVTTPETWWQIAEGSVSPISAVLDGSMRIRGDVQLGRRLVKLLSSSEGSIEVATEVNITGVIESLRMMQGGFCVSVTGRSENFVLFPSISDASADGLIYRSMQVSLMREAFARSLPITITQIEGGDVLPVIIDFQVNRPS